MSPPSTRKKSKIGTSTSLPLGSAIVAVQSVATRSPSIIWRSISALRTGMRGKTRLLRNSTAASLPRYGWSESSGLFSTTSGASGIFSTLFSVKPRRNAPTAEIFGSACVICYSLAGIWLLGSERKGMRQVPSRPGLRLRAKLRPLLASLAFLPGLPRLRHGDRDSLLAALYFPARPASQCATLFLAHDFANFSPLSGSCHWENLQIIRGATSTTTRWRRAEFQEIGAANHAPWPWPECSKLLSMAWRLRKVVSAVSPASPLQVECESSRLRVTQVSPSMH